jgi:hypothetical protein
MDISIELDMVQGLQCRVAVAASRIARRPSDLAALQAQRGVDDT